MTSAAATVGAIVAEAMVSPPRPLNERSDRAAGSAELSWSSSAASPNLFCVIRVDGTPLPGEVDDQSPSNSYSTVAINKRVAVTAGTHAVALHCQAALTTTVNGADIIVTATG